MYNVGGMIRVWRLTDEKSSSMFLQQVPERQITIELEEDGLTQLDVITGNFHASHCGIIAVCEYRLIDRRSREGRLFLTSNLETSSVPITPSEKVCGDLQAVGTGYPGISTNIIQSKQCQC